MPPAAYLPDPGKWIKPGSTTPTLAPKSQQRPLVALKGGLPTPSSNPRYRSSSTTTNENAPKSSAGPSRLKQSELPRGGTSGWLQTPPTTASQPRRQVDRLKPSQTESSKGCGSPVSRSAASQKGKAIARPLKSKLAVREDWKSEEEEDDEIEVFEVDPPRAGPSKPRPPPRKESLPRRSQTKLPAAPIIPPSRKLTWNAFSSSELSAAPPESGDEEDTEHSDDDIVPISSPKRAAKPSPPTNSPPRNPYAHLGQQTQRPIFEDTQPDLTPRVLTQVPTQVLAQHWRYAGHDTDRIKNGEVPWGRSAGRIENAERLKEQATAELEAAKRAKDEEERAKMERERLEHAEQAKQLEDSAEMAKGVVDDVLDDVAHKAKELRMSMAESGGEEQAKLAEGKRTREVKVRDRPPLSPVGLNTGKRIRRASPPSPLPRKTQKRKRVEVYADHPDIDDQDNPDNPSLSTGPSGRSGRTPSPSPAWLRSRSVTITPPKSDELEEMLDPIMEEAKRDAQERDERARLEQPIPPAVQARAISAVDQHDLPHSPEPGVCAPSRHSPHHTITPPKKKRRMARDTDLRSLSPPPRPVFSSSPPGRRGKAKDFKPVEVEETLMTWSPLPPAVESAGAGPENEEGAGGMSDVEKAPAADEAIEVSSSPPVPVVNAEETQSLAATEFSQSYPKFFPSQTAQVPKRPLPPSPAAAAAPSQAGTTPRWSALNSGILNPAITTPAAATPPSDPSSSGQKRKGRTSTGKSAPSTGKQTKLQAYGVTKEKPAKGARRFDDEFEDEPEIEEEAVERVEAGPSKAGGKGLRAVPDAPYHPDLRPAGIRAAEARAQAKQAARPQTRARTREGDMSSPLPVPVAGPSRRRTGTDGSSPVPPVAGRSPYSSSLLSDSTEDETPEGLRQWYSGLQKR